MHQDIKCHGTSALMYGAEQLEDQGGLLVLTQARHLLIQYHWSAGLGIVGLFICGPEACFSAAMAKLSGVIVTLRSSKILTGQSLLLLPLITQGTL